MICNITPHCYINCLLEQPVRILTLWALCLPDHPSLRSYEDNIFTNPQNETTIKETYLLSKSDNTTILGGLNTKVLDLPGLTSKPSFKWENFCSSRYQDTKVD